MSEPFDRVPSAKILARDLRIDDATAKKLHKVLKGDDDLIDEILGPSNVLSYQSGRMSTRLLAMRAADKLYETHGVEAVDNGSRYDFEYLNTGDSYAPTLLFRGRRVWISSWGDEVEALERRGVRFENPARGTMTTAKNRQRNAFMEPSYYHGAMYDVENKHGEGTLVPAELVGNKPKLSDFDQYIESGKAASFEKVTGWFVRLSASGYMDATDWSGPFKSEAAARKFVVDHYEVDPDTGDGMEENPPRMPNRGKHKMKKRGGKKKNPRTRASSIPGLSVNEKFFYDNAGYSYDPKMQTKEQGRKQTAKQLAAAEDWAAQHGYHFKWEAEQEAWEEFLGDGETLDDISEVSIVLMLDGSGRTVQSLGGVTFGFDNIANRQYIRVLEAELALEQYITVMGKRPFASTKKKTKKKSTKKRSTKKASKKRGGKKTSSSKRRRNNPGPSTTNAQIKALAARMANGG